MAYDGKIMHRALQRFEEDRQARNDRFLQRDDVPLGRRVKAVDGFDLIPEKVQTQRIGLRMRPDIDQFTAAGILSRFQYGLFGFITGTAPHAQQRG